MTDTSPQYDSNRSQAHFFGGGDSERMAVLICTIAIDFAFTRSRSQLTDVLGVILNVEKEF